MEIRKGDLLGRRADDELHALFDVALQSGDTDLEQLLLAFVGLSENIDGLLSARSLWYCQYC